MFGLDVTGTAAVFLWGFYGGLFLQLVGFVALILRRQSVGKHKMPKRLRHPSFWIGLIGSGVIGGVVPWMQGGDALIRSHALAFQIGMAWPALLAVSIQQIRSVRVPPGTADPPGGPTWGDPEPMGTAG